MEGLYYLCSENKGADQLRGYREADLRLCFRICKTCFSGVMAQFDSHCRKINNVAFGPSKGSIQPWPLLRSSIIAIQQGQNSDSDQTELMPRLISH